MRVSLITVCYNRKETIEQSILSVLNQDYPHIEYIVIDGNSSDGTQAIIESYSGKIAHYVSEPDNGMYDAINKGLRLVSGDIVGLMHSDDTFYDSKVISKIVAALIENTEVDGIYGDGVYVTNDTVERIVRNRIGGDYDFKKIKCGWLPLHPTVYIKKTVIEKFGYYNLDFKIASDTEFLLRYLFKYKIKVAYLNQYIVKMKIGGLSTNYKNVLKVFYEDYKIYKYHNIPALKAVSKKKYLALIQYFDRTV